MSPLREYPTNWKFDRDDARDCYIQGLLSGVILGSVLCAILILVLGR